LVFKKFESIKTLLLIFKQDFKRHPNLILCNILSEWHHYKTSNKHFLLEMKFRKSVWPTTTSNLWWELGAKDIKIRPVEKIQ